MVSIDRYWIWTFTHAGASSTTVISGISTVVQAVSDTTTTPVHELTSTSSAQPPQPSGGASLNPLCLFDFGAGLYVSTRTNELDTTTKAALDVATNVDFSCELPSETTLAPAPKVLLCFCFFSSHGTWGAGGPACSGTCIRFLSFDASHIGATPPPPTLGGGGCQKKVTRHISVVISN